MVIIPPCHYCIICNPVIRDADNALVYDSAGQIKLKHADYEVRLEQDPFPLYPGESMHLVCMKLQVVFINCYKTLNTSVSLKISLKKFILLETRKFNVLNLH